MKDTVLRSECLQCGAEIVGTPYSTVSIESVERPVCSERCRDIAQQISATGLEQFYRFREASEAPVTTGDETQAPEIYDREAFQREFTAWDADDDRTSMFIIDGVRCAACSWLIEERLGAISGVREVAVDPLTTRMRLRWNPEKVGLSELIRVVRELGYGPSPLTEDAAERALRSERRASLRRLIVAGLGMMQVMSYAVAMYAGAFQTMDPQIQQFLRLISMIVATPVVFYAGAPFFRSAWRGLRQRRLGMDVPVSIAIGAAYIASVWNTLRGGGEVYFDSATMFVFFLSCARFLELRSRQRAIESYGTAGQHLPRSALRLQNDEPKQVAVTELRAGDRILIRAGGVIPVDGRLQSGEARVDEAMLTGESTPQRRVRGERLIAGSINTGDPVTLEVTESGSETVMAQIGRLISGARQERPVVVQLADRIASWFIGGVLCIASAVAVYWSINDPSRAFEIVLSVLVVTCPCALALATPAAFSVATVALARRGFMVRRYGALQVLARATDVLFDKTGTLTEPSTDIAGCERLRQLGAGLDALAIASALEAHSEHPLARAFRAPTVAHAVADVEVATGAGLQGRVDGTLYRIGTMEYATGLMDRKQVGHHPIAAVKGSKAVYLGDEQGLLARFEIQERLRHGARETIAVLQADGLAPRIVSGDDEVHVAQVAGRLGIDEWSAGLLPAGKLAVVRELQAQGRTVVMVGDGINDSPVLAGADTSIAMGAGMPLAHHSASAVLLGNDLGRLTEAFAMARRTLRVIRQNLAWAIGYNLLALPLAAAGIIAPWMAALGMSASSLLVTANALRLGRSAEAVDMPKPCCSEAAKTTS